MTEATPGWVEAVTALLVVLGGLAALTASLGLLRLGTFWRRIHTTGLAATLGTWCFALATATQVSFTRGQPFVHALLIPLFIALTAPITTIFLTRAAIFRERMVRSPGGSSLRRSRRSR